MFGVIIPDTPVNRFRRFPGRASGSRHGFTVLDSERVAGKRVAVSLTGVRDGWVFRFSHDQPVNRLTQRTPHGSYAREGRNRHMFRIRSIKNLRRLSVSVVFKLKNLMINSMKDFVFFLYGILELSFTPTLMKHTKNVFNTRKCRKNAINIKKKPF